MRVRLAPRARLYCFVMRLESQLLCLRSETSSILVRSATGCRPWWPSGFQIRRMRFDSSASCRWCMSDGVAHVSADRACAEGGAPALQAGFLGALPSRSTETSAAAELRRGTLAHAARWPCTSLVSRRIRFDSERGLCFTCVAHAARRSCTSHKTRRVRFDSERGLRLQFRRPRSTVAVHLACNEAGSVRFRTWARYSVDCPRSTVVVHLTRNEVGSVRFRTWAPVVPKAPALRCGVIRDGHLRVFL